jgi:hypothetical protein
VRRAARADPFALAGLAAGGVAAGHALGYALAQPDPALRAAHLAATGHGSFGLLACAAGVAALVAVAGVAWRAAAGSADRAPAFRHVAAAQVLAFGLLEVVERGFSPAAAARDPAVLVGLLLQVAVAGALAHLVRGVVRAARLLAPRPRTPGRRDAPRPLPDDPVVPRSRLLLGTPRRAPPLPSPA